MKIRWKINCIRHSPEKIPVAHVKVLGQKLFETFEKNRLVKKTRSKDLEISDLNVVFVGNSESKRLNSFYRKKKKPTDVLSFASGLLQHGLGELVICIPVIRKQAKAAGHSFEKELDMMLVHGFLHLLGYDHEKNRKEELKMLRLQDRLLKKLT